MPTYEEISQAFASEIALAARREKIARLLNETGKTAGARGFGSDVLAALKSVNRKLDALRDDSQRPLSDADKEKISEQTGEKLGLPQPRRLRRALKEASIDNAMVIVSDIEAIINSAKGV